MINGKTVAILLIIVFVPILSVSYAFEKHPGMAAHVIECVPANLDGDGKEDIVIFVAESDGTGFIKVHYGNGSFKLIGNPQHIFRGPLAGDIDNDGKDELIIRTEVKIRAYRGDGSEIKEKGLPMPISSANATYFDFLIADVDGDVCCDIVTTEGDARISVISKTDNIWKKASYDADHRIRTMVAGKLEASGKPAIVYVTDPFYDDNHNPISSEVVTLSLIKNKDGDMSIKKVWSAYNKPPS